MVYNVDANQHDCVVTAKVMGFSVVSLAMVGDGCPDLLLGFRNKNYLVEIKDGEKPRSQQKLTKPESKFFKNWKGQKAIIRSAEEMTEFCALIRSGHLSRFTYQVF